MEILSSGQLKLPIDLFRESDRNFNKGGRSFYFFDFDDNVIHLPTRIVLFHKESGEEIRVSTSDYALYLKEASNPSHPLFHYSVNYDPLMGSFRNFREHPKEMLAGRPQPLIADLFEALQNPFLEWRGPSWNFFVHAVNNARPISIITARGHHPHTIRQAINILVQSRDLEVSPNYLSLYPVSHPDTRIKLGDSDHKLSVAELKKKAIKAAVQDAFECYGDNPHHRFGMSDDDPQNVQLIREAMRELKQSYPENAFFVFNTHGGQLTREEISLEGIEFTNFESPSQSSFL